MTERTPWRAMLAAALALGVAPRAFWRLSLAEWRALVAPHTSEALSRTAFEALTQAFPDNHR
jgi:uncharacterized phage protein (TIGR02216 family)